MKLFNKANNTIDERLENMTNRIYKEVNFIVFLICIASMIIKTVFFKAGIQSLITEFIIILVSGLYSLVRTVSLGIYSDGVEMHDRKSKIPVTTMNMIIGLGTGIVLAVFMGLRSAILYGNSTNRLWYFILVFIVTFVGYCPFFILFILAMDNISRKVSKKISNKNIE